MTNDVPDIPPLLDRRGEKFAKQFSPSTERQLVMPSQKLAELTPELAPIAQRILQRIRQTTADIIAIGKDLIEVKDKLGQGSFGIWINRELDMSDRTARNYMHAAEWAAGKTEIISDLSPTALYRLAAPSTSDKKKEKVVADLQAGKRVQSTAVENMIREERENRKHRGWSNRPSMKSTISDATGKRCVREDRKSEDELNRNEAETKAATNAAVEILKKLPPDALVELMVLLKQDYTLTEHIVAALAPNDGSAA